MLPTILNNDYEISNMFQQNDNCNKYIDQLNKKENIQSKICTVNNSISDKKISKSIK